MRRDLGRWVRRRSEARLAKANAVAQMGATLVGTSVIVDQASPTIRSALKVVGLLSYSELPDAD